MNYSTNNDNSLDTTPVPGLYIAIIGAGAAGCFAAANIPFAPANKVTVYEKTSKVMQKVKASGGGRCNVTHECFDVPELLTCYPRGKQLLKKTLYRFSPKETIAWFENRGVKLKSELDGRVFPVSDSSQSIIDCIWNEMMSHHTEVLYHRDISAIEKKDDRFILTFADGTEKEADRVLITAGGFPKAEQYYWLKVLGHTIIPPVPSLFTFQVAKLNDAPHSITALMGVSVPEVSIKVSGTKTMIQGALLITHWGFSGPATLKTSAYAARELAACNYEFDISINWLHEMKDEELREHIKKLRNEQGSRYIHHSNPFELPKRLWEYMLQLSGITDTTRWGDLPAVAQNKLIGHLLRDTYPIKGKTTFKEEFVTCGGVSLAEIDPQTMESRLIKGLYFAGEILDVDGITGGYNFQHAWSSGYVAAQGITEK